jgi:hypothetical protein
MIIKTCTDEFDFICHYTKNIVFENHELKDMFQEYLYKFFNFKDHYIKNAVDYINNGYAPCPNCSICPVSKLTPWRSDREMRCSDFKQNID